MNSTTPNLSLPFILPSQAQKHVTHNEALLTLDALVHLTLAAELSTPPASCEDGTAFAVGANPTADWSGRQNHLAVWQDGVWTFIAPREGWRAWLVSERALRVFHDGGWRDVHPAIASFEQVGISTSADDTNRFAISSQASLFTHAGAGHQLKINKQSEQDSATLLFQSGWMGHAEIGLAGDNSLSFKVSDGNDWRTALVVDTSGRVFRPSQPMARAYRAGTSFTPLDGQQSGFTDFALNQGGGFALAGSMAGGGSAILVPANGNFLLSLNITVAASTGHVTSLLVNGGASPLLALPGGAGLQSASTIASLNTGDVLTLSDRGSAQLSLGEHKTALTLLLL